MTINSDEELLIKQLKELLIKQVKEDLTYLRKRDAMLTALEEAGVDNWIGFEDAYDDIDEDDIV